MTNYDYLKNNEEAMVDLFVNANVWLNKIDGEYCDLLCPYRDGFECLCNNDCTYPPLEKIIKLWLHAEHQ